MNLVNGDRATVRNYCRNRSHVKYRQNGSVLILLEDGMKRDLSTGAIVIGGPYIRNWERLSVFQEKNHNIRYAYRADAHATYGMFMGSVHVNELAVLRARDFGGPGVRVVDCAEGVRCVVEDLCYFDSIHCVDSDGDIVFLDQHRRNPASAVGVYFLGWTIPFED